MRQGKVHLAMIGGFIGCGLFDYAGTRYRASNYAGDVTCKSCRRSVPFMSARAGQSAETDHDPDNHISELADRVKRASGADRELDALIEKALPPRDPRSPLPSLWNERAARYHSAGIGDWDDQADYTPTAYTASLDAAMSLVPEGWWLQYLGQCVGGWRVRIETNGPPSHSIGIGMGSDQPIATPALALCAAALRALAKEPHHD